MPIIYKLAFALITSAISVALSAPGNAQALTAHRIPAALAMEAANEVVSSCAAQGYRETAVVLDADGL